MIAFMIFSLSLCKGKSNISTNERVFNFLVLSYCQLANAMPKDS